MRYFQKLLCLLILVLAASFGVGGCVLLYSDFSVQRSRMAAANAAAHAQACTLLQTEILDLQRRGISTEDAALTARVTAQGVPAALWRGDTLVCATLEGLQSLPLGDAATVTVRTENSIYAVYASDLQGGADKGVPPPECGRALLCLDPGGEGGVPDGDTAALQVDDLRLQQGAGLRMGGGVGDGGAAALHGEITVQQHAPADAEGRRQHQHQQADHFLCVTHESSPF